MTTVILIAILIVLLILACTFGLLRQSGKKGRRKEGAFNEALASIAATNADPSIPLTAEAAAMLQQQYPYLLNDPSLAVYRQPMPQPQQQQSMEAVGGSGGGGGGRLSPSVEVPGSGSPYVLRASPHHPASQQSMQQPQPQHLNPSSHHHHRHHHHHQHTSAPHIGSISRSTPIPSPHHHQQQQQTHAAMAAAVAYLPSPAMDRGACGSAEAEFQNDFIEVFPMQHLEPKPDLN